MEVRGENKFHFFKQLSSLKIIFKVLRKTAPNKLHPGFESTLIKI